jgi:predicted metal-dependent hydrolase
LDLSPDADIDPAYRVRVSRRAQRINLTVTPQGEVEVVVPQCHDPAEIPRFVARHAGWLRKHLARIGEILDSEPDLHTDRPARILLHALEKGWQLNYLPHPDHRLESRGAQLTVYAPAGDRLVTKRLLCDWLTREARLHLPPWLQRVSDETGLTFSATTIRAQKTRWGSCSRDRRITLNRGLLFLPPSLVRYLMVHELCHTVHMNHSRRYWALVARHEPGYKALEQALRRAVTKIPKWAV